MASRTKEEHEEIEREMQKHFCSQFPPGFVPRMGERIAFIAGRDSVASHTPAVSVEGEKAAEEYAKKWIPDNKEARDFEAVRAICVVATDAFLAGFQARSPLVELLRERWADAFEEFADRCDRWGSLGARDEYLEKAKRARNEK